MDKTKELDQQYVAGTYGRFDVELVNAKGATYTDVDGKEYIDFGSGIGVTAFGACDSSWIEAVNAQMNAIGHTSNLYFTAPQAKLAQLLCERTGMRKVFFGNSGAEANECAIKVARKYGEATGRHMIVTLWNSFHGRTIATLAATGQDKFHAHFGPFPEGFMHVHANDVHELTEVLASGRVCGLLLELIQGEGGVIALDPEYVRAAEQLCHTHDVLLMIDEVQTGNGRTGSLYAYQQYGIMPDVVTTAKGLGGGLPIGACMMGAKCEAVLGKGDHGSTYGGNPICAAAAVNVVTRINDAFLSSILNKSAWIRQALEGAAGVKEISGMGLMIGILPENKTATEVVAACLKDGLLVLTAHEKVRLLPPLNISDEELNAGLKILKKHL